MDGPDESIGRCPASHLIWKWRAMGRLAWIHLGPHMPAKLIHLLIELEMLEIIQLTG